MANSIFIVGHDCDEKQVNSVYSVWEHEADAESEKQRLVDHTEDEGFYVLEIELNQSSNDPID